MFVALTTPPKATWPLKRTALVRPAASGELTLETEPAVRSRFRTDAESAAPNRPGACQNSEGGLTELALETLAALGAVSN